MKPMALCMQSPHLFRRFALFRYSEIYGKSEFTFWAPIPTTATIANQTTNIIFFIIISSEVKI